MLESGPCADGRPVFLREVGQLLVTVRMSAGVSAVTPFRAGVGLPHGLTSLLCNYRAEHGQLQPVQPDPPGGALGLYAARLRARR